MHQEQERLIDDLSSKMNCPRSGRVPPAEIGQLQMNLKSVRDNEQQVIDSQRVLEKNGCLMVVVPKKDRGHEFFHNGSSFFSRSTISQRELAAYGLPKGVPTSGIDLGTQLGYKRYMGPSKMARGSDDRRKELNRSRSVPN